MSAKVVNINRGVRILRLIERVQRAKENNLDPFGNGITNEILKLSAVYGTAITEYKRVETMRANRLKTGVSTEELRKLDAELEQAKSRVVDIEIKNKDLAEKRTRLIGTLMKRQANLENALYEWERQENKKPQNSRKSTIITDFATRKSETIKNNSRG